MIRRLVFVIVAIVFVAQGARGAGLSLGTPQLDGGYLHYPLWLHLSATEQVASLQFELWPDGGSLQEIIRGDAAGAADKEIIFADRGAAVAVIVAGLNQHAIPAGVIAWAVFAQAPSPTPRIEQVLFSNPRGEAVDVDPPAPDTPPKPAITNTPSITDGPSPEPDAPPPPRLDPVSGDAPSTLHGSGLMPGRGGARTAQPREGRLRLGSGGLRTPPTADDATRAMPPSQSRNTARTFPPAPVAEASPASPSAPNDADAPVRPGQTPYQRAQGAPYGVPATAAPAQAVARAGYRPGAPTPSSDRTGTAGSFGGRLFLIVLIFAPLGVFVYRSGQKKRRRF